MGDDSKALVKSALGRSLKLGQLYDCRNNNPEDGASLPLWDEKVINDGKRTVINRSTVYSIDTEETNSTKASDIDADLSLHASIVVASGSGSGSYSHSKVSSNREVRVTLKYKYISRFEELTMGVIQSDPHPNMLKFKLATHVVTGVEYGIDMNFTFVHTSEKFKDAMDLAARFKVKVLWWEVADKVYEKHEEKAPRRFKENISCHYDGDIKLVLKPNIKLEEVMEIFRKNSSEIAAGTMDQKVVPKRVWLMPLTVIDSSAPKLVRSISDKLATNIQNVLNDLYHIILQAKDLEKQCTQNAFLKIFLDFDLQKQVEKFGDMMKKHTEKLKKQLKDQLPSIRSKADGNEDDLRSKLNEMVRPPFDILGLTKWINDKESEAMTLIKLLRSINEAVEADDNIVVIPSEEYEKYESTHTVRVVWHLNFPPLGQLYLDNMETFLANKPWPHEGINEVQWYKTRQTILHLRTMFKSFLKRTKKTKCVITCSPYKAVPQDVIPATLVEPQ